MAYLVESLIRNRPQIKSLHDEESDEYNSLLILEKKVDELYKYGIISKKEMSILNLLSLGYSIGDLHLKLKADRTLISKKIKRISDKLAYYLGGEYTDAGYLDYMREKHKLTDSQVHILEAYMNGKYHNRIMRKQIDESK